MLLFKLKDYSTDQCKHNENLDRIWFSIKKQDFKKCYFSYTSSMFILFDSSVSQSHSVCPKDKPNFGLLWMSFKLMCMAPNIKSDEIVINSIHKSIRLFKNYEHLQTFSLSICVCLYFLHIIGGKYLHKYMKLRRSFLLWIYTNTSMKAHGLLEVSYMNLMGRMSVLFLIF